MQDSCIPYAGMPPSSGRGTGLAVALLPPPNFGVDIPLCAKVQCKEISRDSGDF